MLVDAAIVIESFAVALLFRFDGGVPDQFWLMFWASMIFAALVFVLLLYVLRLYQSGVYQSILRYTSIYQERGGEALVVPMWVLRVASASAIAAGGLLIVDVAAGGIVGFPPMPLGVILIGAVLAYVQLVAVRLFPRGFNTS
jgi:FlaA1/EpsC-like NDP-sugar epimerase